MSHRQVYRSGSPWRPCALTFALAIGIIAGCSDDPAGTLDDATQDVRCKRGRCCTPTTCAAAGADCGTISDGCGKTLDCGTCTAPETCGGAMIPNVCGPAAGGDTTPPNVAIGAPGSGSSLSGAVTVQGTASDDVGVAKVEVQIDDGPFQAASGSTTWSYAWDTTAVLDGTHAVTARATDGSGNTRNASVSVTVANGSTVTGNAWYVDSDPAIAAHDGKSWGSAWANVTDVTGVSPGDTVYISGGPSGSTRQYRVTEWHPQGGSPGKPVSYRIGRDPAHDGTAIFDGGNGSSRWLGYANYNTTPCSSNLDDSVLSGDAGDGKRHFVAKNYDEVVYGDCASRFRLSYVDFGDFAGDIRFNGATSIEVDHIAMRVSDPAADRFLFADFRGTTWDDSKIHDNQIAIPKDGSGGGFGADGLQVGGTGFSIYRNTIVAYPTTYAGGQHQDGWQGLGGSYVKVHDNYFEGLANYAVYAEGLADWTHLWIYGNVVTRGGGGGLIVGADVSVRFDDVVIANNVVECSAQAISLNNVTSYPVSFTNTVLANNVVLGGGSILLQGNSSTRPTDNVFLSNTQASSTFVQFAPNSSTDDFHLRPGAALIGAGLNLSSYFTTDRDGVARPAPPAAWDVGAYQH